MKLRSLLVSGALVASGLASLPANADNTGGGSEVIVAVIDLGARATHQEFNYLGKASTTDQIVGWYDFSAETGGAATNPAPGVTWDPRVDNPFDNNGHGTATASSAVGRNIAITKEKSFCPGCKLAIAKVGEADGAISGDVGAAIRWSVDTIKADVVNISLGPQVPLPANIYNFDEAIAYARDKGVLVVVSNGNGFANAGVPGDPGWASALSTTNSLSVGGSGNHNAAPVGPQISTDPEVVAKFTQRLASRAADNTYDSFPGTSFSSPLVAGMAAKLMQTAIANGNSASADYIETLLKFSATDTVMTPNWEGYGNLDAVSFAVASSHAAAGTLPSRPDPDPSGLYVETVANGLRGIWMDKTNTPAEMLEPTGIAASSGADAIGPSTPMGLQEGEIYTISTTPGQLITGSLTYSPANEENDIDVYVFAGSGPSFSSSAAHSANSSGLAESFSFYADGGTYSIVVLGWLVVNDQPFLLTTSSSNSGAGDNYYASTFGSGAF